MITFVFLDAFLHLFRLNLINCGEDDDEDNYEDNYLKQESDTVEHDPIRFLFQIWT